jgi:hypothetical protein
MLFGKYPWVGKDAKDLYDNILMKKLEFPISPQVSDLTKKVIE